MGEHIDEDEKYEDNSNNYINYNAQYRDEEDEQIIYN